MFVSTLQRSIRDPRSTASGSTSGTGWVVESHCTGGDVKKLRRIFETDEGASYIGEWSIGCNPRILHPMRDILFDEKIAGRFHLTPAQRV